MARRFAKVSGEEIEEGFFYPSDLVNTKTTIPLRVGEERWIYTETRSVDVYIHHYSPPIREYIIQLVKLHFFHKLSFFLHCKLARTFVRMSTSVCFNASINKGVTRI